MEDRISGLEEKVDVIEKSDEDKENVWRNTNGMCKNSATPLKKQIYNSWALQKEKCKLKA
jgi:hypothetical protein